MFSEKKRKFVRKSDEVEDESSITPEKGKSDSGETVNDYSDDSDATESTNEVLSGDAHRELENHSLTILIKVTCTILRLNLTFSYRNPSFLGSQESS